MDKNKKNRDYHGLLRIVCSISIALAFAFIVICLITDDPGLAISKLLTGPFQSKRSFFNVVERMIPLVFTGLAMNVIYKSGYFNMGADGSLYMGGVIAAFIALKFPIANGINQALILTVAAGVITSWILGYFSIKMKANMVVSGVAINLAANGGTIFMLATLTGDKAVSTSLNSLSFPNINIPIIENIPVIGEIFSGHNALTYLAWISVVVLYILIFKTELGVKIRAVGENEIAAKSVGINTTRTKFISLAIGGILAGFGGMYLSMGYLSVFTAGMVSGRGYLALATDSMAGSNPIGGLLSSLIYGFSDSVSIYLQQSNIPLELIRAFPYIFIVVILIIFTVIKNKKHNVTIEI